MKNHKTLFYGLLGALVMGLAVTSCNDEFSEEDLLQMQQDLADQRNEERMQQALDGLDQAGEFYSFTISLNNDDNFVEGASVTLHGQEGGDVTQTTDANGTTTFSSVRSGGNVITVSAEGFASAILNVDFPPLEEGVNYEITPDWQYIPLPASTSAIVPLFSTDPASGSTATIQGTVEIETDVTNLTPEVPQDIQVTAIVDLSQTNLSQSGGVFIQRYAFDQQGDAGFGVATVDNTTGEYSMMVPATDEGIQIEIEVPTIEANQRIAIGWEDGVQLDRPEYRDIMTSFGSNVNESDIPFINGAVAVFPDPPVSGTGFTLSNFQRVPASLYNFDLRRFNNFLPESDNLTGYEDEGPAVVQFTSLGEGYTSSPTVTITDPTGSNARAEAHVEFAIGGVTVNNPGTGYAEGDLIDMTFIIERLFDDGTTVDVPLVPISVTANADGNIGQAEVTAAVDNAIAGLSTGFSTASPIHVTTFSTFSPTSAANIADEMAGIRVEFGSGPGTAPTGTPILSMGRLMGMRVTDGGNDYTSPSFTFSGGGGTTQAAMDVISYETQWSFDLDNSNATDYTTLPWDIHFEYRLADINPFVSNTSGLTNDVNSYFDGALAGTHDFTTGGILETNGTGGLRFIDQLRTYRTSFTASEIPVVHVEDRVSRRAVAWLNIGEIGNVFELNVEWEGEGYNQAFGVTIEPSIAGAPGSGASIDLTGGVEFGSGLYTWLGGYNILNAGSGYLQNLNQNVGEFFQSGSGPSTFVVRTGDVIVYNINYGTGRHQVDINGDWFSPPN